MNHEPIKPVVDANKDASSLYCSLINKVPAEEAIKLINQFSELRMNTAFYDCSIIDKLVAHANFKVQRAAYHRFPKSEQLFVAVCFGWKKKVAQLIKEGAHVNTPLSSGETPLYIAAKYGHPHIAQLLLDSGAMVNPKSPLYGLIAQHKADALQERLKHDLPASVVSPLYVATEHRHHELMTLLINRGAHVEQLAPYGSSLESDSKDCAKKLLNKGASYTIQNMNHLFLYTAMHVAAFNNDCTAMDILKKNGAKLDHVVDYSVVDNTTPCVSCCPISGSYATSSPLHIAASLGHLDAVRFLVSHGADVNRQACDTPARLHNADIDDKDIGMTPLHYAAVGGHTKVGGLLLNHGAKINKKGRAALPYDWSPYSSEVNAPLSFAINNGHLAMAKLLMHLGAKLDNWAEIMAELVHKGDTKMMALLLSHHGKNTPDLKTYLDVSVKNNNEQTVRFLLTHGARVTSEHVQFARDADYLTLYEFLIKAQAEEAKPATTPTSRLQRFFHHEARVDNGNTDVLRSHPRAG